MYTQGMKRKREERERSWDGLKGFIGGFEDKGRLVVIFVYKWDLEIDKRKKLWENLEFQV